MRLDFFIRLGVLRLHQHHLHRRQVELERPAKAGERHRLHDEDRMSAVVVVVAAQTRAADLRGAALPAGPHAASPRLAVARHAHLRHRVLVLAGRFPIVLVESGAGLPWR